MDLPRLRVAPESPATDSPATLGKEREARRRRPIRSDAVARRPAAGGSSDSVPDCAGPSRRKLAAAARRRRRRPWLGQSWSVQRSAAAAKVQPLEESRRRRSVHGLCAAYPRRRAAGARPAGGTGTSPRDSPQALATPTTPQLHADHRDPSLWERTKPAITEPATS